jgi:hypothetical protein
MQSIKCKETRKVSAFGGEGYTEIRVISLPVDAELNSNQEKVPDTTPLKDWTRED